MRIHSYFRLSIKRKLIDIFMGRYLEKTTPKPNHGLRLDNIIISKDLEPFITNSFMIHDFENSSDHIPVSIYLSI